MAKPIAQPKTDLERALAFTLQWEGGYSNHPNDPGGATNYGITQATYDRWRDHNHQNHASVKTISKTEVQEIYSNNYWVASGANKLAWPLNLAVFDLAVNSGVGTAINILDQAKAHTPNKPAALAQAVCDLRTNFFYNIIRNRPASKVFLVGWLNRVRSLRQMI